MRTRPGLKSCLKITPPITPDLSAASSPCGSGRTSPSVTSDGGSSVGSGGRKSVSFCAQGELEEVFWADEWDRTPSAVTPKLSYQDILELKQLRISLPYSPPPPSSRQPFTTSAPSSSSSQPGPSNKPPFPVSRFATGPSHTPSKWRNRSEPPRTDVDPDILPYLDAVPIRLLPLLPQSPPAETETQPAPEPHPQTPTPTASPEHRPAPPPPSEPPEVEPELVSPVRKAGFAFLPLLPVQDPPSVSPPPISTPAAPARPKRPINMTFLPVNAVPESAPATLDANPSVPAGDTAIGAQSGAPLTSPSSPGVGDEAPPEPDHLAPISPTQSTLTPTPSIMHPPPSMSPPPLTLSIGAHPTHLSGLESDNETEADMTDTDVESDAPSTSTLGSSLPSPPLDDDDLDVESGLENVKLGEPYHEHDFDDYSQHIHSRDPGSYFPPHPVSDAIPLPITIPTHSQVADAPAMPSGPGQTPPLSVLYPSPTSQHQALLPLDALTSTSTSASIPSISTTRQDPPAAPAHQDAEIEVDVPSKSIPLPLSLATPQGVDSLPTTPLSMSNALRKKLMLEALPSPALVPPSPFELDPLAASDSSPTSSPPNTRARGDVGNTQGAAAVIEKLAALDLSASPTVSILSGGGGERSVRETPNDTPGDSPLLTLESIRAAWDARARVGLGVGVDVGVASAPALGPSLSRRKSS
ncbi:hypothetical protein BD413DRAFT_606998 [Trametes elegans]|nr:hypothetical protein BD413DRAFT_606998 [Trametes elegans]